MRVTHSQIHDWIEDKTQFPQSKYRVVSSHYALCHCTSYSDVVFFLLITVDSSDDSDCLPKEDSSCKTMTAPSWYTDLPTSPTIDPTAQLECLGSTGESGSSDLANLNNILHDEGFGMTSFNSEEISAVANFIMVNNSIELSTGNAPDS